MKLLTVCSLFLFSFLLSGFIEQESSYDRVRKYVLQLKEIAHSKKLLYWYEEFDGNCLLEIKDDKGNDSLHFDVNRNCSYSYFFNNGFSNKREYILEEFIYNDWEGLETSKK